MKYFKSFPFISLLFLLIGACKTDQKSDRPQSSRQQIQTLQSNGLEIIAPWARPASAGANSAAYMQIFNGSNQPDTLISIDTDVAAEAEVHESFEENGLSGMRPVNNLVIPPDSSVNLSPGGYHIMLKQLNRKIAIGDSLSLRLNFATANTRSVQAVIQLSN